MISRRDLISSGLALSASSALTRSAWARLPPAMMADALGPDSAAASPAIAPREQLLFDFGWKFIFGHAADPARDLGFGFGQGDFCQDRRLRICQGQFRRFEMAHAESAA